MFFDILDKRDATSLFSRPNLDNRFLVSTSYALICDRMSFDKYESGIAQEIIENDWNKYTK